MKFKKSELLDLMKEEIVDEMRGLTMMDDPYDDSQEPESFKVMDKVAREIESMIVSDNDDAISIMSNYLVTAFPNETVTRLSNSGYSLMQELGYKAIRAGDVEDMISREMDDRDDGAPPRMLQEGMDAESMQIVTDAVQKMAPLIGAMSLPVLIGLIYEQLRGMGAK